jgi:hypothetical protein
MNKKIIPLLSPLLAMLGSRKGIVVLVAIVCTFIAIYLGKIHFSEVKEFLAALVAAYLAATAWEDGKREEGKKVDLPKPSTGESPTSHSGPNSKLEVPTPTDPTELNNK